MIWTELANEVHSTLARRGKHVDKNMIKLVMRTMLNLITDATSLGESVNIKGFGEFRATLRTAKTEGFGQSRYIHVTLKRGLTWKKKCRLERNMKKYAYEQEKKEHVKEAAARGKCPICGAVTTGAPPVCPVHGSEPFEKGSDG